MALTVGDRLDHHLKHDDGAAATGSVPVAVSGADALTVEGERPAPHHPAFAARLVQPSGSIIGRTFIALVPVVFDPFPNVAQHIIESPGIGKFSARGCV